MTGTDAARAGTRGARGHAVVVGGSLTGLLSAWVLAEHLDVTVVERDPVTEGPEFRPGVPQGRHAHALMEGGQRALENLLPGILDELVAAGATRTPLPTRLAWLDRNGWNRIGNEGRVSFLTCTRPLLNWTIRQRVATHPRISFVHGTTVTGLVHEAGAVCGIAVRPKGGEPSEIAAELVVDASGRGSLTPKWLAELGYPEPEDEIIDAGLAYATRLFKRTPRAAAQKFNAVTVQPVPENPTMGLLVPVENDQWLLALGGMRGHEPPTDVEAWMDFAKNLRTPLIHELVSEAEPVTQVFGFRNTQNRRRHYERTARHPEGLLVLGDAACTFNPIYGQGMTAASREAVGLRALLAKHGTGPGLARKAQKMVFKTTANPWLMATSEDRSYPTTVGGKKIGLADKVLSWYISRLNSEGLVNPKIGANFFAVVSLADPPAALFKPAMILAALRRPYSRRGGAVPAPVLAPALQAVRDQAVREGVR
ncbi:FAD-dependent monooxygenase [Streptomyces sp. NPDC097619]|uniref:FAD-dependent oxidoreductase n=1 Tax=Streptomyces sp. NPDC097619 TaxID=3157228 RepID=UPI0033298496